MMKTLNITILAGMFTALLGAPVMGATTLLNDAYGTATSTKGFAPETGVNIGINPPTANRMTGSIAQDLRYYQTITNKNPNNYGINGGRLRVETDSAIGRFTLSPYYETNAFNFGPALGIPNASPSDPVSYDVKVSMRNDATGTQRFSFAIGTAETDANNWDFGVQLYHQTAGDTFYAIQKRIDTGSSGLAGDLNTLIATTPGTNSPALINFLIRVTDAGRETSSYNSRVQVSIDNGTSWIYDTSTDPALVNGFRFDGAGRFFSFDQAGNAGTTGGNVHYDNFSVTWNSGPRTWDGGGANGNWNSANNWVGATPVDGSALIFNGTTRQLNTNNISDLAVPSITFSNGGFEIHGNALTVTNGLTNLLGENTVNTPITLAGSATVLSSDGTLTLGSITGDGQNLTVAGAGNVTVNGAITTSGGGLIKQDAGTLTLGGASDYTGPTTISAGTLALTGSGAIGGSSTIVISSGSTLDATARVDGTLHLNNGQTLSGDGTILGSAAIGGTLSPGASVGSLTTGSETWNSGGKLNWEVSAASGTPGVDWDSVVVNGTLEITASRNTPFVINMTGAAAAGFDNSVEHSWDVVTTTGGILSFDPARVIVVAPGFDVGATGGFGVRVSGNNLQVFFGQRPVVAINNAMKVAAFGDLNLSIGGEGTDFIVTSGAPILGYQWKQDGVNVSDDANISGATTPTLTLAKVYGTNAGNYSITVWNAAGSTTSGDIALSVTKASQHIVATAAPEQNYGDSVTLGSYFVSKDASEAPTGVTLDYSLDSGASIASINNGVLTFNGVGTVTVRAAAPATPDYNAGSDVTGDITAGTRTLTITPDDTARPYGDTNPIFTVSFSGFALGETLETCDITGAESVIASNSADETTIPGAQTITVDSGSLAALSSSHYDFTTGTGTLTITNRALTIVATSVSKTFGDSEPALSWTTNGFVNGDENLDLGGGLTVLTGTPVLSRGAGEDAGTYPITVDTNGVTVNTNLYVLQMTEGVFTINKATPTVNVTSLPGETYNGSSHPTTVSVTGVGGEDLGAATISYTPGDTSAPVDAGDYAVEGSFAGNGNYNAATGLGSIHIGKATVDPVVTVDDKTYDGTTGGSVTSRNLTGVFGGDDVSLTGGTATFASAAAGAAKSVSVTDLSLGGTKNGNYQLSSTSAAVLANITPATIEPQITASDKTYDGTTSATIDTRSLTGVIGTDDVTLTGGTATFDTAAAGSGKTVTAVDLALSGADMGNYQLSTTTATTTANIIGILVTPQITADNKVYDGTTSATIASRSLTGVVDDDDVTLTGGSATFASATAANGKTVTAIELSLSGEDSANYQLTSTSAEATADITKATVTPVVTANNKSYDGTTAATIASRSLSGVIGSDDVALSGGTASFATASAGPGKAVTVSGLGLSGSDSGNYQLSATTANTVADINLATPVITWGPLAPIAAGTTLASTLNASADVPGSFAYLEGVTPVNGSTLLTIGTHTLTAQFTPADNVNYSTATLDRSLDVTGVPDTVIPSLKVLAPKSAGAYITSSLLLTGTVQDAVGVASVQYTLNTNAIASANVTFVASNKPSIFTATLLPTPGTNTLVVTGKDLSGNTTNVTIKFFYHTHSPLTIQTTLDGVLNNTTNIGIVLNAIPKTLYTNFNTNLFVGRTYTLKAVESGLPKYILTNWTATWDGQTETNLTATNSPFCTFEMKSNMVVKANFISNPFYRFGGVYNGLFSDTNGVEFKSAGFASLKLTEKKVFSGKLFVDGNAIGFSGPLDINGTGTIVTKGRNKLCDKPELTITVALDFANGTETVSGTISEGANWTAHLLAHRVLWTTNLPAPVLASAYTNSYTMLLPGFATANDGPVGHSYAVASVDRLGKVKAAGHSADGHVMKSTTVITTNGLWPFFSPQYKTSRLNALGKATAETEGFVMGWLQFATNSLGHYAPTGELHWIKTGWTNTTYAAGFTNSSDVIASRWVAPVLKLPTTDRAIAMTNMQVSFTGGDLGTDFSATYFVSTNTTLAVIKPVDPLDMPIYYPNKVKAGLASKTGLIKGTFMHPLTPLDGKATLWFGVVLQDQNFGAGFFMGPNNGGNVAAEVSIVP